MIIIYCLITQRFLAYLQRLRVVTQILVILNMTLAVKERHFYGVFT